MNNTSENNTSEPRESKPGLFKRIFTKVDEAMQAKANKAARTPCCTGEKDGKDGKRC